MTREQAERLISTLTYEQKLALLGMLEAMAREATREYLERMNTAVW